MAKKDTISLGFEEKIWKAADRIIGTGPSTQKSEPMYLPPVISQNPRVKNTIRKIIEKED